MPDNWEAPLGGVKAVEQSLASKAQKAGTPVLLLLLTKPRRMVVPHGSPHPWGRQAAVTVAGAAVAESLPASVRPGCVAACC